MKFKISIKPWVNIFKMIKYNQKAWLKPHTDMNTDLQKKAKNGFKKYFFKLMNNAVFKKTMENARKHMDIKLVTTEKEETIWYHNQNIMQQFFFENLLATELKKHRLYQKEKIKKVIGLMKDELSGKMMQEFLGLIRAKTYSYLIDDQQQ